MRLRRRVGLLVLLLVTGACAKRIGPPIPEAEDYVFPAPQQGELSAKEAHALGDAWNEILAGDLAAASSRLQRLSRLAPGRPAVETARAYVSLRAGRLDEAQQGFAAALAASPQFAPALAGAGSTAARRADVDGALALYKRALAASPADPVLRKRVGALKLQVTERRMARAQAAIDAGDLPTAAAEYRGALDAAPEVTGVRLALAEVLVKQGDTVSAVATLAADPGGDRQLRLRLAALLVDAQQYASALDVYRGLSARDPTDEAARAGEAAARERLETAAMPEEYRRIPGAESLTRADLAALLVVRVKALRRVATREPQVAVDISGSWAREQIANALALEVLDLYPNHTFQPGALVRRVDLARAAGRILDRLSWPRAAAPAPTDMPRSHLDYGAVERVLGAGLMGLTVSGAFEPWRPVSGRETIEIVDALARLVGP